MPEQHHFIATLHIRRVGDVDHQGVHRDLAHHGHTVPVDQHDAFVGEGATVAVGITNGDVGQFRVAAQGVGAVVTDGVALGVAVDRGHVGFELHHALVVGVGRHGITEQRAARADHVQVRLGHFKGGERVGRVQGDFAAIQLSRVDQPLGLLVERLETGAHVIGILDCEVGHDRPHFKVRYLGDSHCIATAFSRGHFNTVTAHAT